MEKNIMQNLMLIFLYVMELEDEHVITSTWVADEELYTGKLL